MLEKLFIKSFFDLENFKHASLFEKYTYPWEALKNLSSYLKKQKLGNIEIFLDQGIYLVQPSLISIGKGTVIEPGVYIEGPCIIGENCVIRHGAYIRGGMICGDRCVIGHATEIKHSILLNDAKAAHFNYVGDSILGNGVNLGAGVKLANLRLDEKDIIISLNGEKVETGLKKLGAVIGDEASLGCNSVTNPGTLMGKMASCYPCMNVSGVIIKL